MPIRAILFDLGGVFFPWPAPEFFAQWEGRFGLEPGALDPLLWHGPDIEAANIGKPLMKLVVPSIGSTAQMKALSRLFCASISSPMMP